MESSAPDLMEIEWQFDERESVFMGFEAWQTSNEIRSLSVLTMNITCIEEVNAAAVD